MELKKVPKLANEFWPNFIKTQIARTITLQILITISVGTLILSSGIFEISSVTFWIIMIVLLVSGVSINLANVLMLSRPTKNLIAAIISVSGERTNMTPPNPNEEEYEKTGLKDALQTIYSLSSSGADSAKKTLKKDAQTSTIKDALGSTRCGFIVLNNERKIVYANKAAPIKIDSDGRQTIDLLFNGSDNLDSWLDECSENAVHEDHVWTRIPDKLPNEENRRFFDVLASYQKDSDAETVLTLIDRTSLYTSDEEDLDFISFAAHELRGPITVIKGYADILQDELSDKLQGDQIELFRRLAVSSNRLSGYIDNILNTSRYDRRHLKMNLVEGTVAGIYGMIADDMALRASSQRRILNVKIPNNLPTIAVDRASMSEVFGNLIDNAIKYSNEGGIINVSAKVTGDFVDVSVEDNGIGMPETVVANLFQKFYRSHRSRETVAGTGIGLYISKAIVESHGGTISVHSQEGKGSAFTVSIPIYATVADKLQTVNNSNEGMISEGKGWIKNHSMYRS